MRLIYSIFVSVFVFFSLNVSAQSDSTKAGTQGGAGEPEREAAGVAVSPSKVIYNAKYGTSQTRDVRVSNDSKKTVKFQISFNDFMLSRTGKPLSVKQGESKYGLSSHISAIPSYFELKPGATQVIKVTLNIPNNEEANISGWTLMAIDEITERAPLSAKKGDKTIALGIVPSFGFGIYIYNNPPGVKNTNVEIEQFAVKDTLGKKRLEMTVHNVGDGIGFCAGYAELTYLATGKIHKIKGKTFTILPGFYRDFVYEIPAELPKGKYSVVGVVDFGNDAEIKAAELDLELK